MDSLIYEQDVSKAFITYLTSRGLYVFILSTVVALLHLWANRPRKAAIPVLSRHEGWTAPWKDAVRYLKDSPGVLKEGYEMVSHVTVERIGICSK